MLSDPKHGPLPLSLLLLTALSGVVDAVSYLGLGHVFVANMTGNVVFLGLAAAGAPSVSATGSIISLGAFFGGSVAGGRIASTVSEHRGRLLMVACTLSAIVILAAAALSFAAENGTTRTFVLVGLLSATMGLQSAAARRVGVPDLNTTVVTMTLVALASETGIAPQATERLGIRIAAIVAMLVGAFVGATLLSHAGFAATLAAAALLAALTAVGVRRVSTPSASWARPS
jgi:uncharacterized membrane protein YoaK (UPF0700 family)